MCGRFGFVKILNSDENYQWVRLIDTPDPQKKEDQICLFENNRYDVRPTQNYPVIYKTPEGSVEAENMKFGLFPDWSKAPIINARMENLEISKLWKSYIFNNRCIVLASYFYEWQASGGVKTIPWLIKKRGADYLMFAALYAIEKDKKTDQLIKRFAIITQNANTKMREIHNHGANKFRQPVILDDDKVETWMNSQVTDMNEIQCCMRQYQSDEIDARPLAHIGDDTKHLPPEELHFI